MQHNNSANKTAIEKRIVVSDDEFIKKYNVEKKDFFPIDLEQIQKKELHPENIKQGKIGNCYFLAAIGTIARHQPDFLLTEVITVNKNKVEVSFYDVNDLSVKYTYILDPTKIYKKNVTNEHTHDAIAMLEKAYAIHRLMTEPTKYNALRADIREAIEKRERKGESILVDDIFTDIFSQYKADVAQQIQKYEEILNNVEKIKIDSANIDVIMVKSVLTQTNNDTEKTREILQNQLLENTRLFYKAEIKHVIEIKQEERKDYISALKSGNPHFVYKSLFGTEGKTISIDEDVTDINYLCGKFLAHLRADDIGDKQVQTTLAQIFGDASNEIKIFTDAIQSMDRQQWKAMQEAMMQLQIKIQKKEKPNIHVELIKIFMKFPKWLDTDETTEAVTKIRHFIEKEIPHKKGTGKYTSSEEKIYNTIWDNLHQGNYISLATNENPQTLKKGLVMNHAYEVVNCFKRHDKKFVLVRNPWDSYVRDYEYKDTKMGREQVTVLHAIPSNQLSEFQFFRKSNPRDHKLEDPALSSQLPKDKQGYFEIELADLCKNCSDLYIASSDFKSTSKLMNIK